MTALLPDVAPQPAPELGAIPVVCPRPNCPTHHTTTGMVGALRRSPAATEDRAWIAASRHHPGQPSRHPSARDAARWVLDEHVTFEHDYDYDDPTTRLAVIGAVATIVWIARGDGDLAGRCTTTGSCAACCQPLAYDGDQWVDAAGDTACEEAVELCTNFCRPHRAHLADPPCHTCGGHGAVHGTHSPIPTPRRQDGGPQ